MKNYKYRPPLLKEVKEDRNQLILNMRKEGHTLQSIANKFGCSREWIRLVLKNEFNTTKKFVFKPEEYCGADEYTAHDIVELTGYPLEYLGILISKNWIPKSIRVMNTEINNKIERHFWKQTDIDKWIKLKIKYLKIALEGYLQCRLTFRTEKYRCAYKFTHPNLQRRYKLLVQLQSGDWKGKLSYNSRRNDEVMKEFYGYIKPFEYIANDYSKYLNEKTNEDYAQKGLFNGLTTAKMIQISNMTLMNFRKKGALKEGTHFIKGDHYFHQYMYYPEKTKQAIIDAGYDQKIADRQRKMWAKKRGQDV